MNKINMLAMSLQIALDLGFEEPTGYRSSHYVERKITEELGEMVEEFKKMKNKQPAGKDGIRGEAVDFMISVADLFFLYHLNANVSPESVKQKLLDLLDLKDDLTEMHPDYIGNLFEDSFENLVELNGQLALCANIRAGLSYKTAETFGVAHIDDEIHRVMLAMFENAMYVFKSDLVLNVLKTEQINDEDYRHILAETWFTKMNKWRKSRGLALCELN